MPKNTKIEINAGFQRALELIEEEKKNVFITGRAGTGKSTLLQYFRTKTKRKIVVLAPTGVAAINVGGQTIHSFFKFKPNITAEKVKAKYQKDDQKNIYRKIDAIVIDEISMVRADLLDCVDKFMRLNGPNKEKPFGGVQLIFIGDLYQLPPVVTSSEKHIFSSHYASPYFFSARVFERPDFELEFLELEKIYRQKDEKFINLLNLIRNRTVAESDLKLLNQRLAHEFEPAKDDYYIYLTTTNDAADVINREKLARLPGKLAEFEAEIVGNFSREYFPTAQTLELKAGAQVMMLSNDSLGRWVNGSIAKILAFEENEFGTLDVLVQLENGEIEEVSPHTWDVYNFFLENGKLFSRSIGSFTQYPLRLAFAITIHKSQGKTFDKAVIDIGRGTFAHGQMYVALSRCRTLEGIVLKKEIKKNHIIMDWNVVKFVTSFQYRQAEKLLPLEAKIALIKKAIKEKQILKITYLKGKDEKSQRLIRPKQIADMAFSGYPYLGLTAFCLAKKEDRTFNVERILACEIELD
jgi:ATP-dependent DNA helicase PIF1